MGQELLSVLSDPLGATSQVPWSDVIVRSLILMGVVIGGLYVVLWVKRWLKDEQGPSSQAGFTLSDLRELHRRGQMTDEEFERAKNQMLSGAKAMADRMPHPLNRPGAASDRPKGPA